MVFPVHLKAVLTKTNNAVNILIFLFMISIYYVDNVQCSADRPKMNSNREEIKPSSGLPFSEKFSQLNIKELRSSLETIDLPNVDFPNVKSHFGDIPKDESETKSGVMPSWTLKMPELKLNPEHFRFNENPRNFVKEHFENALKDEGLAPNENKKTSEGNVYKERESTVKNTGSNPKENKKASTKSIGVSKDEKAQGKRSLYKFKPRRRAPPPPRRPVRPTRHSLKRNKREFSWVFRNSYPTRFPTIFSQSNGFRLTGSNVDKSDMIKKKLVLKEEENQEKQKAGKLTPIIEYNGQELQRLLQQPNTPEKSTGIEVLRRSKRNTREGINFPNIFNQAGRTFYTSDVGRSGSYIRNHHNLGLLNKQRSYLYRPNVAADVSSVQTFADNIFAPSTNRFIRAHHNNRQPHSHRARNTRVHRPPPRYPPFDPFGNTAYIPLPGLSNPNYALPLQSGSQSAFSGSRGRPRQRPFQSTRTRFGQHTSLIRGSIFSKKRGNRGNNENRPIRNIHHHPNSLQNAEDLFSNEVSIDDPFSYKSSAEFESSNVYKKLRSKHNKGYYHLP